jgi:FKBP-type peptidyl-prolyl cis-trans isomerase FklB
MIKKVLFSLAVASIALSSCNNSKKVGEISLSNERDSASYCIGRDLGNNFKKASLTNLNEKVLIDAMHQVFNDEKNQISDYKARVFMQKYFQKLREKAMKEKMQKDKETKEAGDKFLAENKTKEGVKTTESGLQYKVIKEGNGEKPVDTSIVSVHYVGTFIDGKEFDSSVKKGKPVEFPVKGVIPGWTEALKLMSVGSKYKLFIPSNIAYGPQDKKNPYTGQIYIPANSTLIFEVELLDVMTPAEFKAKKEEEKKKREAEWKKKAEEKKKKAEAKKKASKK